MHPAAAKVKAPGIFGKYFATTVLSPSMQTCVVVNRQVKPSATVDATPEPESKSNAKCDQAEDVVDKLSVRAVRCGLVDAVS